MRIFLICCVFRLVGIGESDLQELVDDSLHQVEGLEVAYCARVGEVDVRLVGSEVALKQGEARLRILAGAYVLAPVGASLEKAGCVPSGAAGSEGGDGGELHRRPDCQEDYGCAGGLRGF